MAVIAQGVLKEIRDEMFAHMQLLPVKYFDTHTHGDPMSRYTNDTDTPAADDFTEPAPDVFVGGYCSQRLHGDGGDQPAFDRGCSALPRFKPLCFQANRPKQWEVLYATASLPRENQWLY